LTRTLPTWRCPRRLRELGVFGFDPVEVVILAALVSEDPLLLIGRSGTGKTFLLNSLSEALAADPAAFAQIEVGVWADHAWLSGTIVTRKPLAHTPAQILVQAGLAIGLDAANHTDATRYRVTDTVCQNVDDPTESRAICDDQCIVVGHAGYDRKTRYLPPEHFLAHSLVEGLWSACRSGLLQGCGPDGKVLIVMREEAAQWVLETVLDARWAQDWRAVEVLVNPNGPHLAWPMPPTGMRRCRKPGSWGAAGNGRAAASSTLTPCWRACQWALPCATRATACLRGSCRERPTCARAHRHWPNDQRHRLIR
jgi:hypothetical protein